MDNITDKSAVSRLSKKHLSYLVPIVLLVGFLLYTDPQDLSLPLLLVPFFLLFLIFFSLIRVLAVRAFRLKHVNNSVAAFILALFPVMLLLLSSANQVSATDLGVMTLLFLGIIFYLRRVDFL